MVIKKYISSFGDSRYQDYTMHKHIDRKTNDLSRHGKEDHTEKQH